MKLKKRQRLYHDFTAKDLIQQKIISYFKYHKGSKPNGPMNFTAAEARMLYHYLEDIDNDVNNYKYVIKELKEKIVELEKKDNGN